MIGLALLLAGCPEPVAEVEVEEEVLVPLSAPELLRRMSLDLRGVLPTLDELDRVEADPAALEPLRDGFLEDPRLEERLVRLLGERWHTRIDTFEVGHDSYGLTEEQEYAFERGVGEEPLRLVARVVVDDLPWSEVVLADYTVLPDVMGDLWPVDYPDGETGWQVARYTDGRPAAGVLSTNGLWWRYVTNPSNQNRARVAAFSRLLLCQDLLSRPVSFSRSVSLADEEGTAEAIRTEASCLACHATIEPLAASLFGFWTAIQYNPSELETYHAERENLGPELLGVEPGYFGTPIQGLVDLGPSIAEDPRFWRCAAETWTELLWRRETELADFSRVEALRQTLLTNDERVLPLLRAITDTPEYRAGSFASGADEAVRAREATTRMMTSDLLASAVEDLTGYRWTTEGFDQLDNDQIGYRILAGGVDGDTVTAAQREPGLTSVLVIERLAQAASSHAVRAELVDGAPRRLLQEVTLADLPGDAAFDAELLALHRRLHARTPDATELAEEAALWEAVDAVDGPEAAWTTLVAALLRDPAFVGY